MDCSVLGRGAYTVPCSLEGITFESDAKFLLVVQTGGMFQRLASHRFRERTPCVLVEMAGVPTRATWALNFVIDEYLPVKLKRPESFLPRASAHPHRALRYPEFP